MMRFLSNVSHGVNEPYAVYFLRLCDKNVVFLEKVISSWILGTFKANLNVSSKAITKTRRIQSM